ncbi:MFS transporter [Sphingomonas sp.]|uniref:MFS transporter n=1 Tax=Sphingomonas sp. TaxID=28214 RepID=UPI00345B52C7
MKLPAVRRRGFDGTFALLFTVMLAIAAGNTALQSVLPALGRSLDVADNAVAAVFSVSALLWVIAAPYWANRSDRYGRRAMVLVGIAGFTGSLFLCGLFLALGINGLLAPLTTFIAFIAGRVLYGAFGSAAPPAVQAIVAGRTSREERTRALTLLASAFGLGTILGPAIAPYLVFGDLWPGGPTIGLSGPAFAAAAVGVCIWIAVIKLLPRDEGPAQGAAIGYPRSADRRPARA